MASNITGDKLECVMCFGVPRPDKCQSYGLCDNDHYSCSDCFDKWLKEKGNRIDCPYCRSKTFRLRSDHSQTTSAVAQAIAESKYPCQVCNVEIPGPLLLDHEKECIGDRQNCPLCLTYVSPKKLFALKHPCIPHRCSHSGFGGKWDFRLSFDSLFRADSAILMAHNLSGFRLCLVYKQNETHLTMNVFWVHKGDLLYPEEFEINLAVCLFTKAGTLKRRNSSRVNPNPPSVSPPTDNLKVKNSTLAEWEGFAQKYRCKKCSERRPHFHIIMGFDSATTTLRF